MNAKILAATLSLALGAALVSGCDRDGDNRSASGGSTASPQRDTTTPPRDATKPDAMPKRQSPSSPSSPSGSSGSK